MITLKEKEATALKGRVRCTRINNLIQALCPVFGSYIDEDNVLSASLEYLNLDVSIMFHTPAQLLFVTVSHSQYKKRALFRLEDNSNKGILKKINIFLDEQIEKAATYLV